MHELLKGGALEGERYRVIVTTDIGGSDPDDFQSMVHYLLYADMFDTEGLISAAWGTGRKEHILEVIDQYEKDYPNLKTWSDKYPEPDYLRSITKQGAIPFAPYKGYDVPNEGSEWIIRCARKEDDRPLYLLMWGLLEDLAQALHDAPDILPKLRVNYIGGPNKKWGQNAYAYIRENFPDLWMIEDNSAYRGWFNGGDMSGDWGNESFVTRYAAGAGALGDYFTTHLGGVIKMGDTPTVSWLLRGDPTNPEGLSWGGTFERVRNMPEKTYVHPVTVDDPTEAFAEAEVQFTGPVIEDTEKPVFMMDILNQQFEGFYVGNGQYRFRFVPKEARDFSYVTRSDIPEMDGLSGVIRVTWEKPETRARGNLTNWWSDSLKDEDAEGVHRGAKTVNRWRKEFLADFAERFARCAKPKA